LSLREEILKKNHIFFDFQQNFSSRYVSSLLFLAVAVVGTTMIANSSITQAWADVFEGTEGPDDIVGTLGDDTIDSKGGDDRNFGDIFSGDGSGDDVQSSGEGGDRNFGDTEFGDGSGDDAIVSGDGDDQSTGKGGADIFACGEGKDTVTDYNEAEGDIAAPDCENV